MTILPHFLIQNRGTNSSKYIVTEDLILSFRFFRKQFVKELAFSINTEIKINGQKLETVTSFKCLGSVITDEGSKPEILTRLAQTTAALTRLKLGLE